MSNAVNTDRFEVSDFREDIIEASYEQPVLVDFWAPWCGPCQTLGPLLEELSEESTDWTLVKVNTDENPEEARKYGVRGIPAVKLFVDGSVADEFTGALPRRQIERWLKEALPGAFGKKLQQARQQLQRGDTAAAREALEELTANDDSLHEAHILLARTLLFDDPERARALLNGHVADAESQETAETVLTLTRLLQLDEPSEDLPEGPGREPYRDAVTALRKEDFDTALVNFITTIQIDRGYDNDGARRACLAIFQLLGPNHEITQKHRRMFDMSLY